VSWVGLRFLPVQVLPQDINCIRLYRRCSMSGWLPGTLPYYLCRCVSHNIIKLQLHVYVHWWIDLFPL
jgi:hypothetical protein